MRMLHTSDWHLGRCLHRADLREAQAGFLDHLVETVRSERVDLVCVAGDVYDRALPSVDAVELAGEGLRMLAATGARVVLISGNHDSRARLGFGADLIDAAGVHLRTAPAGLARPVLLDGDDGVVAVYALPYLEPEAVRHDLPADPADPAAGPARGHAGVLGRAMDCVRADLAGRRGARSVVLAHAWVAGGDGCDSERDIGVGGVARVPTGVFDGVDYTALGHLHRAQTLAPGLRYSGSPLPYSFSEAGQVKGSWLVELGAGGLGAVEFVPAPVHRRLALLRGRLADLLTDPRYADHHGDYLSVELTDGVRPDDPMRRLQTRFPYALTLAWCPAETAGAAASYAERICGRDDLEVAAAFVAHVRRSPADAAERDLLAAAFTAVSAAGAVA